jgi:acyl carrier protein
MNERVAVRELVESLLRRKGDQNGFADSDSLIVSGRLDSVDTIALLLFLEKEYGIDFADRGFDRDEMDSVDSIVAFLGVSQLPI